MRSRNRPEKTLLRTTEVVYSEQNSAAIFYFAKHGYFLAFFRFGYILPDIAFLGNHCKTTIF